MRIMPASHSGLKFEPEEGVRRKGEYARSFGNGREKHIAQHLDGLGAVVIGEIEGDGLGKSSEVGHAKNGLVRAVAAIEIAQVSKDLAAPPRKK
jgi:hypothetical protein